MTIGISVRTLDAADDLAAVEALFLAIWPPGAGQPASAPVNRELLRAIEHTGGYVGGAFDGGVLVGAAVGFFAAPDQRVLHSHVAGVAERVRGRSVGWALKQHQHAWAASRGLRAITWTFDPLVRRNAHFNLTKLGAMPEQYLTDFYGEMVDEVNAGQGSDRLLVSWPVDPTAPGKPPDLPLEPQVVLAVGPDGGPVPHRGPVVGAHALVATPADVERLRLTAPEAARAWRAALREALEPMMAGEDRVVAFTSDGSYVVERRRSQ